MHSEQQKEAMVETLAGLAATGLAVDGVMVVGCLMMEVATTSCPYGHCGPLNCSSLTPCC